MQSREIQTLVKILVKETSLQDVCKVGEVEGRYGQKLIEDVAE